MERKAFAIIRQTFILFKIIFLFCNYSFRKMLQVTRLLIPTKMMKIFSDIAEAQEEGSKHAFFS